MLKLDLGITNFTKTDIKKSFFEKVIFETLKVLNISKNVEISLMFVGESRMRRLNYEFRKKNKPTDVLSFSFFEEVGFSNKDFLNAGEIIICIQYAKRQAKKNGVSLKKELALLATHGTIHLFGIDHERSKKEHEKTEEIQKKVLSKFFK